MGSFVATIAVVKYSKYQLTLVKTWINQTSTIKILTVRNTNTPNVGRTKCLLTKTSTLLNHSNRKHRQTKALPIVNRPKCPQIFFTPKLGRKCHISSDRTFTYTFHTHYQWKEKIDAKRIKTSTTKTSTEQNQIPQDIQRTKRRHSKTLTNRHLSISRKKRRWHHETLIDWYLHNPKTWSAQHINDQKRLQTKTPTDQKPAKHRFRLSCEKDKRYRVHKLNYSVQSGYSYEYSKCYFGLSIP